mmetsp:Transcript_62692/g.111785  ORF Transcript_62692/g.111785 Transcript_62692/m.111785 type:complete len:488 (-) Transcript_62692:288-1751(-)
MTEPISWLSTLFRSREGAIAVIDPKQKKLGRLWIDRKHTVTTNGLSRLQTSSAHPPSLCLLYQQNRCHAGPKCNQVHVKRLYMKSVWKALQGTTDSSCCAAHGDLASRGTALGALLAHHGVEMKVPRGKPLCIPAESIASTAFLERHLHGRNNVSKPLVISSNRVCNLHQKDECRYGADCNNIHICREFWSLHAKHFISQKQQVSTDKRNQAPKALDPKHGTSSRQQLREVQHLLANDAHAWGNSSLSNITFVDGVALSEERFSKLSDTHSCIMSEAESVGHHSSPDLSSTTAIECPLAGDAGCTESSINIDGVEPQPIDQCMERIWRLESFQSSGSPQTPFGTLKDDLLHMILVHEDNVSPRLEKYLKCSISDLEPCGVVHSTDSVTAKPQTCNMAAFDWSNAEATSCRRLRGVALMGNMLPVEFPRGPSAPPGFAIGRGRRDDQAGQPGCIKPFVGEVYANGSNSGKHPVRVSTQPERLRHIYQS